MLKTFYQTAPLKKAMAQKGWNTAKVAVKAKIHATTVDNVIITGTGRDSTVSAIARALGVKRAALKPRVEEVPRSA